MIYLFNVGDKVCLKHNKVYNNITFTIVDKSTLSEYLNINTYTIHSIDMNPLKEIYIDESYLKYDPNYLRKLKLKQLFNAD